MSHKAAGSAMKHPRHLLERLINNKIIINNKITEIRNHRSIKESFKTAEREICNINLA